MMRITENEIPLLKKYGMDLAEITKRYDIVPMDEIEKVLKEGLEKGTSIKMMAEQIQLPYNRLYHYYKRLKAGKPLKYERAWKIDNKLVWNILNHFDEFQKENGRLWTMQDLAVQLSDHLPEIPSIGWCQNKLAELEVDWNDYK